MTAKKPHYWGLLGSTLLLKCSCLINTCVLKVKNILHPDKDRVNNAKDIKTHQFYFHGIVIMICMEKVILTQTGFDNFKKENIELLEKRKDAVLNLTRARDMGDLSENGFYKAARHELSSIDRRLRELEYILKYASIIKPSSLKIVSLGSRVKVLVNGKDFEYEIVGKYEANPSKGKLSDESIVGQRLLGKKSGDKFDLKVSEGSTYSYEILKIN